MKIRNYWKMVNFCLNYSRKLLCMHNERIKNVMKSASIKLLTGMQKTDIEQDNDPGFELFIKLKKYLNPLNAG